jgi:hypothetical protein
MAIAIWCLVGCCLGVLCVHRDESRLVTFGGLVFGTGATRRVRIRCCPCNRSCDRSHR